MKIEFNSSAPIYIQIINEIKREIVSGEREPGSKVEPVREMAQKMGVNPNTVQRAFAQLERDGLMCAERTAGRYITGDSKLIKEVKGESVMQIVEEFVKAMQKSGLSKKDIIGLVEKYLERCEDNA